MQDQSLILSMRYISFCTGLILLSITGISQTSETTNLDSLQVELQQSGAASNLAYEEMNIGKALIQLKRYDSAAEYLTKALAVFKQEGALSNISRVTAVLSSLYKARGDYKRSEDYLEQSVLYEDSVYFVNQKEEMAKMLAKYETEKKDKTIQLLNTQNALVDKEISKNRVIEIASFCLVALVIALAIVLWKQVRIRQQLKEVKMRNQIAGDLHDDIGSSLSSILLLSNMAVRNNTQNEDRTRTDKKGVADKKEEGALDKIGQTAREVIEKMNDIVWTMNPENDGGISIKERLEKLAVQVRDISSMQVQVNISDKLEPLKIPMELRKNIFLICKEALNNIVKHADASIASLSVNVDHKHIFLEIKDNGKGFDTENHHRGNGLGLMAQRALACGGECRINSIPEQGACITVVLPAPHSR
jgi:two-component system, NarL family, sensor histidine kinase UhpB